jgi:uncharacterized protein YwgA
MNRLAQDAVLTGLARRLEERGSWSGETHLQKAAYLLAELCDVDFDFDFILYKHGPFSFELRDELASMREDRLLDRVPQGPRYGPRMLVTDRGRKLEQRFGRVMTRHGAALDWVAERIGDRGVLELERLATGQWVTDELGANTSVERRAQRIIELKPHVTRESAEAAITEIDGLRAEATTQAKT